MCVHQLHITAPVSRQSARRVPAERRQSAAAIADRHIVWQEPSHRPTNALAITNSNVILINANFYAFLISLFFLRMEKFSLLANFLLIIAAELWCSSPVCNFSGEFSVRSFVHEALVLRINFVWCFVWCFAWFLLGFHIQTSYGLRLGFHLVPLDFL